MVLIAGGRTRKFMQRTNIRNHRFAKAKPSWEFMQLRHIHCATLRAEAAPVTIESTSLQFQGRLGEINGQFFVYETICLYVPSACSESRSSLVYLNRSLHTAQQARTC